MGNPVRSVESGEGSVALPSLGEQRAKIVGLLVAAASAIAQQSTGPESKPARVVQAYASKSEAA